LTPVQARFFSVKAARLVSNIRRGALASVTQYEYCT
jgi:hypothetical protein